MENCRKCGNNEVYLQQRGMQVGAYCTNCGAWLKWVGKKELPLFQRRGIKVQPEGADIVLKHDAPMGVVSAEPRVSVFQLGVQKEEDLPTGTSLSTQNNTDLDVDIEIEVEKRLSARLRIEQMKMAEELEKLVEQRLSEIGQQNIEESISSDGCCVACNGEPLQAESNNQVDITIYGGVMTVTNLEGTNILGFYRISRCPICGKKY